MSYKLKASSKQASIILDDCPGIVLADTGRLLQIIGNLVNNAVKYSPAKTDIHIGSQINGDLVRIYVRDQRPGIPEESASDYFRNSAS